MIKYNDLFLYCNILLYKYGELNYFKNIIHAEMGPNKFYNVWTESNYKVINNLIKT